MARPREIDRDRLLDAAEGLVARGGTAALTFGALAQAAGVPKASVQSAFGTRPALVEAMLERGLRDEQRRFEAVAGPDPAPDDRLRAHLHILATDPEAESRRIATLLAALAGAGAQSDGLAAWCAARLGDLDARTEGARRRRRALLAAEGAFFLRFIAGVPIGDALWQEILADLRSLAEAGGPAPGVPAPDGRGA